MIAGIHGPKLIGPKAGKIQSRTEPVWIKQNLKTQDGPWTPVVRGSLFDSAYHKKKLIVKQNAFKLYAFDDFSYLSSFNIQIRLRNGVDNSDHDRMAQK